MFIATSNLKITSLRQERNVPGRQSLAANNIALRWSARFGESPSYKHIAPTGRSTQNDFRCTSKLNLSKAFFLFASRLIQALYQRERELFYERSN